MARSRFYSWDSHPKCHSKEPNAAVSAISHHLKHKKPIKEAQKAQSQHPLVWQAHRRLLRSTEPGCLRVTFSRLCMALCHPRPQARYRKDYSCAPKQPLQLGSAPTSEAGTGEHGINDVAVTIADTESKMGSCAQTDNKEFMSHQANSGEQVELSTKNQDTEVGMAQKTDTAGQPASFAQTDNDESMSQTADTEELNNFSATKHDREGAVVRADDAEDAVEADDKNNGIDDGKVTDIVLGA